MTSTQRRLITYVLPAFLGSWLLFGIFAATGGSIKTPGFALVGVLYMYVPALVTVVLAKFVYHEPMKDPLGLSFRVNWWWFIAWATFPVLMFPVIGVSVAMPDAWFDPQMTAFLDRMRQVTSPEQVERGMRQFESMGIHPFWLTLPSVMIAGLTINAVAAFGEELGWRGWLLKETAHMGFWRSSWFIGLVWGLWHGPIILQGYNYPDHPVAGVVMMTLFTLLLSPILSYVRLRSGSVIVPSIAHGTLNAAATAPTMVIGGGSDLTTGFMGTAGLMVLTGAVVVIWAYERWGNAEPIENRLKALADSARQNATT